MHGSGQGRAVLGQAGLGYCVRSQGQGVGFVHHDRNLLETTGRSPGVQLLRESIRGSCHSWPLALPRHCNCLLSQDMQHVGQKSMFLGCGGTQSTELGLLPDLGATLSRQCTYSKPQLFTHFSISGSGASWKQGCLAALTGDALVCQIPVCLPASGVLESMSQLSDLLLGRHTCKLETITPAGWA